MGMAESGCFQWFKDTNLKANHNLDAWNAVWLSAVFNGSKILIWKQITTLFLHIRRFTRCFQWFKDTNLKANHNWCNGYLGRTRAVFNGSKILIWKQITTRISLFSKELCCFQWFKDTNLKANHNLRTIHLSGRVAVFNGSKILIWKQITTLWKDLSLLLLLFSMVQRY